MHAIILAFPNSSRSWSPRLRCWSSRVLHSEKLRMVLPADGHEPCAPAKIETVRCIPPVASARGVLQWGAPCSGERTVLRGVLQAVARRHRWMSLYTVLDASELHSCNRKSPMNCGSSVEETPGAGRKTSSVLLKKKQPPEFAKKNGRRTIKSRTHKSWRETPSQSAKDKSPISWVTLPRSTAARPVESTLRRSH